MAPYALSAALVGQVWTIVWLGYGAWRAAGKLSGTNDMADRVIAAAILFSSACVCANVLLGSAGLLAPLPMFLVHGAIAAAGVSWGRKLESSALSWRAAAPAVPLSYLAVAAGALMVPHWARGLVYVPVAWDELSYHLFKPAVWLFDRELSRLTFPYPLNWLAYYPANAELIWTSLMGVARSDLLLHALNVPLLCVLALVFTQLSRICGASWQAGGSFALVLVTLPVVLGFAPTGYVEGVLNLSELAAVLFGLRWLRAEPSQRRSWALLCGLAAGLAVGTKYAALPVISTLAGMLLLSMLASGRGRHLLAGGVFAASGALSTGAYWYVRNALDTGNPFYPVPFAYLPHIDRWQNPWHGSSILDNFGKLLRSEHLTKAWFAHVPEPEYICGAGLGWFGVVLFALALVGAGSMLLSVVRPRAIDRASAAVVLATISVALMTYLRLPYWNQLGWISSQVRFLTPFVYVSVAAGLGELERRVGVRSICGLAALGVMSNAAQLNWEFPLLERSGSLVLLALLVVAGCVLVRARKVQAWWLPALAALVFACLPALVPWREQHRYELLRTRVEVHQSRHAPLVASAEYVARNFTGIKLAVVMQRYEFLSMFTGGAFDVRPIYVMAHAGPAEPNHYIDGDQRREWNREVWLQNLRASGATMLLIGNFDRHIVWSPEREWIESLGFRPRLFGEVRVYDLRSGDRGLPRVSWQDRPYIPPATTAVAGPDRGSPPR